MLNQDFVENDGDKESPTHKTISRQQNCLNTKDFEELVSLQTCGEQIKIVDTENVYDFSHNKRGYAVLIMNYEFANPDENLPGVKHDIDSMSKLFSSMCFDVKPLINLTHDKLVSELYEIQARISSDCDCFVCVISTHGGEDPSFYQQTETRGPFPKTEHYLLNTSGAVWTRHIMEIFDDRQCRALRGKPRLFFVQACRGNAVDRGVDLIDNNKEDVEENEKDDVNQDVFQIPCYNDSLVMFSSTSGKYAWSEDNEGGWLLTALEHVLSYSSGEDLLSLLTEVCGDVSSREAFIPSNQRAHRSKSTACIYHKLCKDIYFPPPKLKIEN